MIWLTWRQFRTNAWVALATLAALAVVYAVTGPHLAHLYATSGLPGCRGNCEGLRDAFANKVGRTPDDGLYWLGLGIVVVTPALIGVFWGAPLVARELETGTHRLAWNQSITRTRWLAVKVLGVGLAAAVTAGLLSLAVSWWSRPIDAASTQRLTPQVFLARGVVPVGYAVFAFALGVTVGVIVRRALPAMAITLAIVVFAQVAMPLWVRPHLIPPVTSVAPLDARNVTEFLMSPGEMIVVGQANLPGAWILSNRSVTPGGHLFTGPPNPQACGENQPPQLCQDWVNTLHLKQVIVYQPADRFWPLQWAETGIFVGLALLLTAFGFWWVRRRLT
jgi:ABC-2 family transporter protein